MTRVVDVTLSISDDMLVWPGDPAAEVIPRKQLAWGDPSNVSELRIGTHTGTHVDPPVHFIEGGHGIDRVPLDTLYGAAVVAHLPDADGPLGRADLDALDLPDELERLLLKTSNSDLWRRPRPIEFPHTYACLSLEGARWVVERGLRLIGVDFLSVEQKGAEGHPVHKELLSNGVVIVEGLDLGPVDPGPWTLACFPLNVRDGDGGPARAALIAP
ncbi:MAG: cyclase family protein [Actinomycetota bacterium]